MEYCVTTFDPYTQSELILFLNPCSFFVGTVGISLGPFTFESVMVFVGGVLILSSGQDPIKSRRQVISCAVCGGVMSGQRCTSCRSVWCSNCEAWNHPQVSMDETATKLEKCAVCGSVLLVGDHIRPEKCE